MDENNNIIYSQKNTDRPVTLAELTGFAKGILIDIPSPIVGETIKVKVKRLDLTKEFLNKNEITNFLNMEVVKKYKNEEYKNIENIEENLQNDLQNELENGNNEVMKTIEGIMPLLDDISKQILVEPTYEDFQNTCGLTSEMKMALFGFAVGETQELVKFRNGR